MTAKLHGIVKTHPEIIVYLVFLNDYRGFACPCKKEYDVFLDLAVGSVYAGLTEIRLYRHRKSRLLLYLAQGGLLFGFVQLDVTLGKGPALAVMIFYKKDLYSFPARIAVYHRAAGFLVHTDKLVKSCAYAVKSRLYLGLIVYLVYGSRNEPCLELVL